MPEPPFFYEVLTAAITDVDEHGYDSPERLDRWLLALTEAAERTLTPMSVLDDALRRTFGTAYKRLVEKGAIERYHQGVPRFTVDRVKTKLLAELDRRTASSAQLIRLNRAETIEKVRRRFAGWASSVPPGGTTSTDKVETKAEVRKALAQLPFVERRVAIDQGHKFVANLNEIIAQDGGAIAARWASHWRQGNYDYREDHKERDGRVYLIRDSWAHKAGFVKPNDDGYTDAIEKPGQLVYCRCAYVFLYALKRLPEDMLTEKGKAEIERVAALRWAS